MTPKSGTHSIGPDNGRLTLNTYRAGMGAKIGHDLVLEAKSWSGSVEVDGDDPGSCSVQLSVDPNSFEVVQATGGVKPLSDKDRVEIAKNIEKTLDTKKHPQITFQSTKVTGSASQLSIEGNLTIAGRTQPATIAATASDGGSQTEVTGKATVVQSAFGIKPYSAMLGALKVRDDIEIEIACTHPSAGPGTALKSWSA